MQKYYDKTPTQGSTNPVRSDGLNQQLATIGSKIGDLSQLETTDKTDLVSAINEVKYTADGGIYNLIEKGHSSAMTLASALQQIPSGKYAIGLHIIFNLSGVGVVDCIFTGTSTSDILDEDYWRQVLVFEAEKAEINLAENLPTASTYYINAGVWATRGGQVTYFFDLEEYVGRTLTVKGRTSGSNNVSIAFLTDDTHVTGETPSFDTTMNTERISLPVGSDAVSYVIPSTSKYLWVNWKYGTGYYNPSVLKIEKVVSDDSYVKMGEMNAAIGGAVDEMEESMPVTGDESVQGSDLDIVDENSNVLVRFEDGHIKTKKFDSSKMQVTVPDAITFTEDYNTDILATARNYILRLADGVFHFSNDCGKTWTDANNTIGDITFVHFFSNGTVLLCGTQYCYTTKDFVTFTQSTVYDADGSVFVSNPDKLSFFRLGNYSHEYHELNGQEVLIWNDYNTASGYVSRVWMSLDYGATIRCILKNNSTQDTGGNTISTRHFHRVWLEDDYGILWVTSGDTGAQCRLTKGIYANGAWTWETIGTPGILYKLTQIVIRRPYAYFVTDYTDDENPTGMVVCPVASLDDPSAFHYLYKTENNDAMSSYFEDEVGNRIMFGDGMVYNKIWMARGNFDFKKVTVNASSSTLHFSGISGSNYLGQCICGFSYTTAYSGASNPKLSERKMFMLSDWLHDNGFADFGSINNLIK